MSSISIAPLGRRPRDPEADTSIIVRATSHGLYYCRSVWCAEYQLILVFNNRAYQSVIFKFPKSNLVPTGSFWANRLRFASPVSCAAAEKKETWSDRSEFDLAQPQQWIL
jgi:hypothetical protein